MNQSMLIQTILIVTLLSGCGGDDESDFEPRFSGAWSGSVNLVDNSCPRVIPEEFESLNIKHNINEGLQSDATGNSYIEIVLEDGSDSYTGLGNETGDSFSVVGTENLLPGFLDSFRCVEIIDYRYDGINFETGEAGYLERHSSITCTRGQEVQTCDVTYTGAALKT